MTASEAVSVPAGDGSLASSISEPADFSPRSGLVLVPSEAMKEQVPSNKLITAMMPRKTYAAMEDRGL